MVSVVATVFITQENLSLLQISFFFSHFTILSRMGLVVCSRRRFFRRVNSPKTYFRPAPVGLLVSLACFEQKQIKTGLHTSQYRPPPMFVEKNTGKRS